MESFNIKRIIKDNSLQYFPLKAENCLNNTEINTEKYFDVSTTQISSTNLFEEKIISTTMVYAELDLALLPNNNEHSQDENLSGLLNNNIIDNDERSTEINTIENLEQSIRNSVKSEIETEQHSEPSQVMEILKELTDPEIRETLSADIMSLNNLHHNNLHSSVQENTLLANEIEGKTERLPKPNTKKNSEPESYKIGETTENEGPEIKIRAAKKGLNQVSPNSSSNEIISITFEEAIANISTNSKEESILDANEYTSSVEQQLTKKGENNNTEDEYSEHVVIKKVLNVEKNSDAIAETTFRPYSDKELFASDRMDSLNSNFDQVLDRNAVNNLNINHSVTIEAINNKININESEVENHTQNENIDFTSSFTHPLSSSEVLREESVVTQSLDNSNTAKFEQTTNYSGSIEHMVLPQANKDLNHKELVPLKKSETDTYYQSNNFIAKNIFKGDSNDETFISNNFSNNQLIKYNQSLDKENFTKAGNVQNIPKEKGMQTETTNTETYSSILYNRTLNLNNTEQNLNTVLLKHSESKALIKDSKELKNSLSNWTLSDRNKEEVLDGFKGSSFAATKDFPSNLDDTVATLFKGYTPQDAGQTLNDHIADEISGIGIVSVCFSEKFNRSAVLIILSSGTACLLIIASVIIYLVSFQRQNGTLNIEMQERSCGKDNLNEEDDQTFAMLLEVEPSTSVVVALDETEECL